MQPTASPAPPPTSFFSFYDPPVPGKAMQPPSLHFGSERCYFTKQTFDELMINGCDIIAKLKKLDGPDRTVYEDGNQIAQMLEEGQFVGREFKSVTYYDYMEFNGSYNFAFNSKYVLPTFLAQQALGMANLEAAQAHIARALGLQPNDTVALGLLREMYVRGEVTQVTNLDLPSAKRCFQRLHALFPEDAYTLLRLGEVALHEEDCAKAQSYFEKTVALAPEWGVAHARLGDFLAREPVVEEDADTRRARLTSAAHHLHTAIKLEPKSDFALACFGRLLYLAGPRAFDKTYESAEFYLNQALEVNPENALARELKATIESQPEMDEVVQAFEGMLMEELENSELTPKEQKELRHLFKSWNDGQIREFFSDSDLWTPPREEPEVAPEEAAVQEAEPQAEVAAPRPSLLGSFMDRCVIA